MAFTAQDDGATTTPASGHRVPTRRPGCILGTLVLLAACGRGEQRDPASRPPGSPSAPAPEPAAPNPAAPAGSAAGSQVKPMVKRDKLPSPFDLRVTRALEIALVPDVSVAFFDVAMTKSPHTNYRYELHQDGKLFYVQHSGKDRDWQQPFDQPLPTTPAKTLSAAEVTALVKQLEDAGFFAHPGYEADEQVQGGSYWIVRVRKGNAKDLHTVVFQNTMPAYVDALVAISNPLRKP